MSGLIILFIVLAVAFAGLGLQVLSLHLHRFPVDSRRPGSLVFSRRSKPGAAHSTELRRLVAVVSNAILNDRSAQVELNRVFEGLGSGPVLGPSTSSRRDQGRRSQQLERAVRELERHYGLEPGPAASPTSQSKSEGESDRDPADPA